MGPQTKDITGQRFERLRVVAYSHYCRRRRAAMWTCRCDCGTTIVTAGRGLRYGSSRSCGCLQREATAAASTTHGLSGGQEHTPRLYSIWRNMRHRCRHPRATKYHLYGGRGITVCEEWGDYLTFHKWALANGYQDDLTLDRIDSDGNYEPGNCQWVTRADQGRYTRQRRVITFQGQSRSITEWAEHLGIDRSVLFSRINDYGWPIEKALTTPVRSRTHDAH